MAALNDEAIRTAPRLCFFAHYHPRGIVADVVLIYLRALADAGFTTVVQSTAALSENEQAKLRDACARLVMRTNVGLDFGGWIDAYRRFEPTAAEFLLFANDSVYAPIGDLSAFIERLTSVPADFYGAVESNELAIHLQSWFLLLRPAAYAAPAFRTLMAEPIPADMPKLEIIRRYELGLTQGLVAAGLRYHAAYGAETSGPIARTLPFNPTHLLWDTLIERFGIPFLKVELLRDNPRYVRGLHRWPALARRGPPGLADAIAADLALRYARAPVSLRERLDWSVTYDRHVYWPELYHHVRRDSLARSPLVRRVNQWAFRRAEWIGRRIRWRIARTGRA